MARSGAGSICGPLQAHALSHPGGKISRMVSHSTPGNSSGPCWHCVSFDGMAYQGNGAFCTAPSGPRVRSAPASGCVRFVREVGSDDEPGPPRAGVISPGRSALKTLQKPTGDKTAHDIAIA